MAYASPSLQFVKNNVIRISHPNPIEPLTYLTASVAAAGTVLTVRSNEGFSNTDPQSLILLENLGSTQCEIKRVNGAITYGADLTVQAVTFAHDIDTPISRILFNQAEISGATTLAGAKTVIATVNLGIANYWTDYVITGTTYNFYFVRFYNSLATTVYYGAYSDGTASTDFTFKNVGFIIRNAFENIGENVNNFSQEWIYDQIYLGEMDVAKSLKRWSWLVSHDYDLGNLTAGQDKIALPSDIEDNQTNKSILGVRIENRENMWYLDRIEFENAMNGVALTTLASTASVGATTLTLTDSDDFAGSGSVNIAGTSYTYTANNRTTNVLSGLTALAAEISSGVNVWQNISFGSPSKYTINNGYIYWDIPPDSDYEGRNVWLDYYKTPAKINSDGDNISVNDGYLIQLWLEGQIKKKKQGGVLEPADISYLEYIRRKNDLIRNELSGQKLKLTPDVLERRYDRPYRDWFK